MKHDEIRDKKKLAQWIKTYTHTSLLEVYTALSRDSGAIHLIGSFFVFVTLYMSPYVCRNRPKSAIFTALFSPRRMLRAARSRWTNPLPAKYSCLQGKQKLNLAPRASLYPFLSFLFFLRITVKESFDTVDKEGNLIKCGWRKEFLAPPFSLVSRAHLFVEIQMGAITFTYLKTGNKTEKNWGDLQSQMFVI